MDALPKLLAADSGVAPFSKARLTSAPPLSGRLTAAGGVVGVLHTHSYWFPLDDAAPEVVTSVVTSDPYSLV